MATKNRELAALRRAFKIAFKKGLVATMPVIELAKERNRRTGFFEWEQFVKVREHLPEYLKPVFTVAYFCGWRVPSEILTRTRSHIVNGFLVLEAGEAKNEEPRQFPLDLIPELKATIERQLKSEPIVPLLFHNNGRPIVDYLPAWKKALKAAGVSGRIPHDFRRTAARNLINSGVDPFTTMLLVGWKDIGMLKRYAIVDENMLRSAVAKLNAHHQKQLEQKQEEKPSNVVAIR